MILLLQISVAAFGLRKIETVISRDLQKLEDIFLFKDDNLYLVRLILEGGILEMTKQNQSAIDQGRNRTKQGVEAAGDAAKNAIDTLEDAGKAAVDRISDAIKDVTAR